MEIRKAFGTTLVPFDQIASVYFHMSKLIMGQQAWVIMRDGQKVELPTMIVGLFDAYEMLCESIKPRILDEVRRQLAAGEMVSFGSYLSVGGEGLTWKGRLLWWEGVQALHWGAENHAPGNAHAVRSVLMIDNPGCERILMKAIPNLPILVELLEKDYNAKVERGTAIFR